MHFVCYQWGTTQDPSKVAPLNNFSVIKGVYVSPAGVDKPREMLQVQVLISGERWSSAHLSGVLHGVISFIYSATFLYF